MSAGPVKVGIVGLGRWARVLTRAGKQVYTENPIANTLEGESGGRP